MSILALAAGVSLIITALHLGYRIYSIFLRRPASYPTPTYVRRVKRSRPDAELLVCLGDSITQGNLGASYVRLLEKRLPPDSWIVLNAGINGDPANNVLDRLDDVIAAQPSVVTILIGTNDLYCSMSDRNARIYIRQGKIKRPPSPADSSGLVRHFAWLIGGAPEVYITAMGDS